MCLAQALLFLTPSAPFGHPCTSTRVPPLLYCQAQVMTLEQYKNELRADVPGYVAQYKQLELTLESRDSAAACWMGLRRMLVLYFAHRKVRECRGP